MHRWSWQVLWPNGHDRRQTDRQTDVRQHHRLMPPGRGHNNFTHSWVYSDYRAFLYRITSLEVWAPDAWELSSWQTHSIRADTWSSGKYALTRTSLSSAGTRPHWRATLTAVSILSPEQRETCQLRRRTQAANDEPLHANLLFAWFVPP